ncbi:alpha/beta hydrolase [Virgisporangium ochraceum]|uniref:Hydrolase n=1 Tax=Virgisporangium ochraceum TaxID=65505 RepID=A0A8J3ZZL1_9ACTN|nr:alpha/beta hydrolase [Virgisporangium ochraceum]GIJ72183.1 hydrolase [Virgisporangium ochraceum]
MTRYRTAGDLFYREAGDPANPTLLLLHGFPASSFMFRDLIPKLCNDFHLVAPDYPGFGHSAAPDGFTWTFDHLADAVEAFTDALGLDRYGLYMQDFGGPVGFRLALRRPERVSFLVVQNANAYEEGLPDAFWAPVRAMWADPTQRAAIAAHATSDDTLRWNYLHGTADPERISPDSWVLQRALLDRPGVMPAMADLLYDYRTNPPLYPRWQDYLRRHQPPTLVVWGRNDAIFPAAGAHPFARDLPSVDLNILETGHFALEDHADVIAAHIIRFAGARE